MFSFEQKYKQLLIERVLLEKEFDNFKGEFIRLQNDMLKRLEIRDYKEKGLSRVKEQRDSEAINNNYQKLSPQTSRFQIKLPHSPKILSFN